MPYITIQSSFQFGEVSELLHARVDAPQYNRSVKRLRNMLVIPQGGCEKRFGTRYINAITDNTSAFVTNYTKVQEFIFDHEDNIKYEIVIRPDETFANKSAIDIYWKEEISGGNPVTILAPWLSVDIASISHAQSTNIVFFTQGNNVPATLVRTSAVGVTPPIFSLNIAPDFLEYPTFDFSQDYFSKTFSVTIGGVALTTVQNTLGRAVTITASADTFHTNNWIKGLFIVDGGIIRFDSWASNTSMTGIILNTFDTSSALFNAPNSVLGQNCIITERAFSTVRGYPQKVGFFQNRLFFGRTKSLLGGLWGSNYNGYNKTNFTFDDSEALDNNSISTVLQGNKATVINNIVSFKTLLIFTSSGLYSTPLLIDLPLTPSNISFVNLQTSDSSSEVQPLVFDNDVVFFDKGGKKVKNVNVLGTTQHYETKNISVLSPHLVDQPYSAAVFENSSIKDGNWLFSINSGESFLTDGTEIDGSLAIYQSVPEQEIVAWSLSTTDGKFRHVASDEDECYFIVERFLDGNDKLVIEKLDFDLHTDCATTASATDHPLNVTISGLDIYNGKSVRVRGLTDGADGMSVVNVISNSGVVVGGSITLDTAVSAYEVGLGFYPQITTLPLGIPLPHGNTLYQPKSIKSVYIDFYKSLGIRINDELIPPFRINSDTYDNPAAPKTDFVQIFPMTGWDPNAEISITQTDPLPLTLLGIGCVVTI